MNPEIKALLTQVLCHRGLKVLCLAWIPGKILPYSNRV